MNDQPNDQQVPEVGQHPELNAQLAVTLQALHAVGNAAERLGADPDGRSEARLYAELSKWSSWMADRLVADRAISVALGEKLFNHVALHLRSGSEPNEQTYFLVGSLARFVAEQANREFERRAQVGPDE